MTKWQKKTLIEVLIIQVLTLLVTTLELYLFTDHLYTSLIVVFALRIQAIIIYYTVRGVSRDLRRTS